MLSRALSVLNVLGKTAVAVAVGWGAAKLYGDATGVVVALALIAILQWHALRERRLIERKRYLLHLRIHRLSQQKTLARYGSAVESHPALMEQLRKLERTADAALSVIVRSSDRPVGLAELEEVVDVKVPATLAPLKHKGDEATATGACEEIRRLRRHLASTYLAHVRSAAVGPPPAREHGSHVRPAQHRSMAG